MIIDEITSFLKISPPYDILNAEQLSNISTNTSIEFFPRGQVIHSQNGPPSSSLGIIKKGGVKIYIELDENEETVIDFRSKGDSFGYLSLFSSDKSRTNIVAIEDTICYMVPKEIILKIVDQQPLIREFFLKSFFVHFIDKTYEEMHNKHILSADRERVLYTSTVGDLMHKKIITSNPDISIKEAANIMSDKKISCLILVDDENIPVGLITLRDFRDRVIAEGLDTSLPVKNIMSSPDYYVESDEYCFEAQLKMISHNIHHLLVLENKKLKGIVTNTDFMLQQGISPISIVKSIEIQNTPEGLVPLYNKIDQVVSSLITNGVNAKHVVKIISNLNDKFLNKIIKLNSNKIGKSPAEFTSITYGSAGRMEQTFKATWNRAIICDNSKNPSDEDSRISFCEKFINILQETLVKYGFPLIDLKPFGNGIPIFANIEQWEEIVKDTLTSGDNKKIISVCKFLDLRSYDGNNRLSLKLKNNLYNLIKSHKDYMKPLIDIALNQNIPVGFFKNSLIDSEGKHTDRLDLRSSCIYPIVDCIRILAIDKNIDEISTTGRLNILTNNYNILNDLNKDISSAYEFLLNLRIRDQIKKMRLGHELDDHIATASLTVLEKRSFKEVFQIIVSLQNSLNNYINETGLLTS